MKKKTWLAALVIALGYGLAAFAIPLGSDATLFDGREDTLGWHWWGRSAVGAAREDEEGEAYALSEGQKWDLEGFFFDDTTMDLRVVGGYNFRARYIDGENDYRDPGHLFLDVTGDAGDTSHATFGYEYAMRMNFETFTYDVFALVPGVRFVEPEIVKESGPFRAIFNDKLRGVYYTPLLDDVSFTVWGADLPDSEVAGLVGDRHFVFGVDLSFLQRPGETLNVWTHFTMRCGNDNLLGYLEVPPIPDSGMTLLLLGAGVTALGILRRRLT